MIRAAGLLAVVGALSACGTTVVPQAVPTPPPSAQEAEPCRLVSREILETHHLEQSSDYRGETTSNCVWSSVDNFSIMVLIGWGPSATADFHQIFSEPVGTGVEIDGVNVVVSKSKRNPTCGAIFSVAQGTVVEVAVGYPAPASASAACTQAKVVTAGTIRKLREQQML
ncbi:DUF3558 family protein [Kribbella sp. NPDC051587]|uniref:DUF3558 family protein n=1 Tax=Kribbella sp. NPDC051587 TaxID=3364119 RepID=UPI0037A83317